MSREFKELEQIIDVEGFLERVGDDRELAKELATLFLQETPRLLAATAQAAADKDPRALANAAHAIKGSAANFSAPRCVQAAAALERIGRENTLSDADAAYVRLHEEVRLLSEELRRVVEEL
jgi:HPt (histidine-containing phosphotransfer) domain-containing protein